MLKDLVRQLGFAALKAGISFPDTAFLQRYSEWAYRKDLMKRLGVNCVLDVGANEGQFATNLRKLGYDGYVYSFEPIPENYEHLSRIAVNDEKWDVFNLALGCENTRKSFNIIKSSGDSTVFSSFLNPTTGNQVAQVIDVEVQRLDTCVDELIPKGKDLRIFLKVDTQGYDVEVIKGSEGILPRIVGLQSEISVAPIYQNMPHYTKALEYYESLGFSLMNLFIVNRTMESSILEYDCIMARLDELK